MLSVCNARRAVRAAHRRAVRLQRAETPPPGSWPKMIVSPSHENAAEWPVGLYALGVRRAERDLREHVVVEEPRVVQRPAVLAAEAPDREALTAGTGRLHRAAEDHAGVVAGERRVRRGRSGRMRRVGRLEAQELAPPPGGSAEPRRCRCPRRPRSTGCCRRAGGGSEVRHAGGRVRAARQVDGGDQIRVPRIADVEDVQALEAGRHGGCPPRDRASLAPVFESHDRTRMVPQTTTSPWPAPLVRALLVVDQLGRVARVVGVDDPEASNVP